VQFHRCFRFAELRPREQREAQIDGGGVQGIGSTAKSAPNGSPA
jgi:hypothetical protein